MPIVDDKLKLVQNAATFEGLFNAVSTHPNTGTKFFKDDLTWDVLPKQFQSVITVSKDGYGDFVCSAVAYTSDDKCIQAAIDYAAAAGIPEIWIMGPDKYTLLNQLVISHSIKIYGIGNPEIYWGGATNVYSILCTGSIIRTTTGSNVSIGDTEITVSDATTLAPGDLVIVYDDVIWEPSTELTYTDWKTGEIHEVKNVSGSLVTFSDGLLHNYTTANNVSVIEISPVTVEIDGIKLTAQSSILNYKGLYFNYASHSKISNCILNTIGYAAITIYDSYDVDVSDCTISECSVSAVGYGVQASNASAHIDVHDCTISACRHCIATGGSGGIGQVRDYKIYNNTLWGGISWAVDAHQIVESIYIHDNIIHHRYNFACVSSAKHTSFKGNYVYGCCGCGMRGTVQNITYEIEGNKYDYCGDIFYDASAYNPGTPARERYVSIKNNTVTHATSRLADVRHATTIDIENNFIDSDVVSGSETITVLDDCTDATGWGLYTPTGGDITSITVDNGRLKVIGHTGPDYKLFVAKTFNQALSGYKYISYTLESGDTASIYPLIKIFDSAGLSKSWGRLGTDNKIGVSQTKVYIHELHAPEGDIGSLPSSIDAGFVLDTLTQLAVGMYQAPAGAEITFYIDNIFVKNGTCKNGTGIKLDSATGGNVTGNTILNGYGTGISLVESSNMQVCNNFLNDTSGTQQYGIVESGTSNNNNINNNRVSGSTVSLILKVGSATVTQNNPGYNPVGNFTAPTIPASTVAYTNSYGYPCSVSVSGGTVTEITLDGMATGLTFGSFVIPPSGTIAMTYSSAPTWKWWGL